jgi:hypothetical protein
VINMAVGCVSRSTRGMPRTASGLAVEAAWISAHLMLYPLGVLAEPARKARTGRALSRLSPQQRAIMHEGVEVASTPILLIHGIVDNHSVSRSPPPCESFTRTRDRRQRRNLDLAPPSNRTTPALTFW